MFAKLKAKWLWFWHNHVQKTMGWIASVLLGLDITGNAEPIKALVGPKKYYAAVLASAIITTARAHMSKGSPPPVA